MFICLYSNRWGTISLPLYLRFSKKIPFAKGISLDAVVMIKLDLSAAFNMIDREFLLLRLRHMTGIRD